MSRFFILFLFLAVNSQIVFGQTDRLVYQGGAGPGKGKNIVLISGDEEYRSEEALPLMAKLLAVNHGFNTTVLFATDENTGIVNPENQNHISGLETLKNADLVILMMRFRELPDSDMKFFDDYLKSGKPIVALRTSTHAFSYGKNKNSPYAYYSWDAKGGKWPGGFGKQVLGETWVAHHGNHGKEGTRALLNGTYSKHPLLQGIDDIWGETDVYTVNQLPVQTDVLLWGQVTLGMTPSSELTYKKAVMPLAWTREYTQENGKKNRIFASTLGTALEFAREDMRRLVVNAAYWTMEMEDKITPDLNVAIPGTYKPTMFGFGKHQKNKKPADFEVR